jgi:release factor glutamine methyltransferase
VSNPPYIREAEKEDMQRNVLDYEPATALFVPDNDPLLFYREIAEFGKTHLKSGGKLYFEINQAFGNETVDLLSNLGYKEIILRKDMFGKDRMIRATHK